MRCRDAVSRLWDYLDGTLTGLELTELEAHLAFCLRCCGELAFARELRERLRDINGDEDEQVLGRLTRFVETLPAPGRPVAPDGSD